MITVKFNEAVDFSSIFDVVNWVVKGLGVKKVKVRNGLIARYYNYRGDTSNTTINTIQIHSPTTIVSYNIINHLKISNPVIVIYPINT